jgi:hypothetical protein
MKQLMIVYLLCSLLPGHGAVNGQAFSGKTGATRSDSERKPGVPAIALKSRTILVLLDMSPPYRDYQTALAQLVAATENLGPGDRLQVMLIAGNFTPQENRYLTTPMPVADRRLFIPTRNIQLWRRNQAELDVIWKKTVKNAKATALNLQRLNGRNRSQVTNLWGALTYGALWLRGEPGDEKILIVASDLEQNFERQKTTEPPPTLLDFKGVRARLLWITYNDKRWKGMESHWRQYFQQSGAVEFNILDPGRSTPAIAIAPSSVPRQVPDWRGKQSQ